MKGKDSRGFPGLMALSDGLACNASDFHSRADLPATTDNKSCCYAYDWLGSVATVLWYAHRVGSQARDFAEVLSQNWESRV